MREPFYDMETKNESFLAVHKYLEEQGIKNNKFFLELKNKKLQGKDPFSQQLKFEDIPMIQKEARDNIWYFFRECLKVRLNIGTSTEAQRFTLTIPKLTMISLAMNNCSQFVANPRQTGTMFCAMALFKWLNAYQNKQVEVISYSEVERDSLCNESVYYFDFPPYMLPAVIFDGRTVRNIWFEDSSVIERDIVEHKIGRILIDDFIRFEKNKKAFSAWTKAKKKPILLATVRPIAGDQEKTNIKFARDLATNSNVVTFSIDMFDNADKLKEISKKKIFFLNYPVRDYFNSDEEYNAYLDRIKKSINDDEIFDKEVMMKW